MDKERNKIIATNIKKYIKEKGITQKELAKAIDISPSTLSDYMNLRSNPSHGVIQKIADYFEILKSDIDTTYKETKEIPLITIYNQLKSSRQQKVYEFAKNQLEEQNKKQTITVYGTTAAGEAIDYGDPTVEEKEVRYVPKGADCALNVKGDSMEPEIKDGSIIFYTQQPQVENGEIAVVELEGDGVTCKKVKYDFDNKKIILQSLNPKYEDMVFNNNQIKILGKVVK